MRAAGGDSQVDVRNINGTVHVSGLTRREVRTAEEVSEVLSVGMKNRATSSTKMNERSSRSHLVFRLELELTRELSEKEAQANMAASGGGKGKGKTRTPRHSSVENGMEKRHALIHLIDLAGSERYERLRATLITITPNRRSVR